MPVHIKRSLFGVTSLLLWFSSITMLPLATAMTLNYMSPVWIALITGAGAALAGTRGADRKLIGAILMSFAGVLCLLQPSVGKEQLTGGLIGLISGVFTALAYVEVRQLGQLGEPEGRIVFYFSLVGAVVGLAWMLWTGPSPHTAWCRPAARHRRAGDAGTDGHDARLQTRQHPADGQPAVRRHRLLSIWGMLIWSDRLNALSRLGMALIIASGIATTLTRARAASDQPATPATPVESAEAEVHPEV